MGAGALIGRRTPAEIERRMAEVAATAAANSPTGVRNAYYAEALRRLRTIAEQGMGRSLTNITGVNYQNRLRLGGASLLGNNRRNDDGTYQEMIDPMYRSQTSGGVTRSLLGGASVAQPKINTSSAATTGTSPASYNRGGGSLINYLMA